MRVIAGEYGGRRLESLEGKNTRPTSDKLKETLFNIIGPYFDGGQVLDLYAGSGGLGIEAVSRGMDKAILVDKNRAAVKVITNNVKVTKEEQKFDILNKPADVALNQLSNRQEKFALVFLDPPYSEQTVEKDLLLLGEYDLLSEDSLVICEVSRSVTLPENVGDLSLQDERNYGKTSFYFYTN